MLAFLLLLIRLVGIGLPQVSADLQLELADLLSLRYEYHDLGLKKWAGLLSQLRMACHRPLNVRPFSVSAEHPI